VYVNYEKDINFHFLVLSLPHIVHSECWRITFFKFACCVCYY